jgi:GUN4-like/Effector-associated domain 8
MVELGADTIKELMELLGPFMEDDRSRRPFLVVALGNDAPVLQYIDWRGAVATFIPHMVDVLAKYGEITPGRQALWVLLEYAGSQVGVDIQQRIDKLRPVIEKEQKQPPPPPIIPDPIIIPSQVDPVSPITPAISLIDSIGEIPLISEQGIDYTQLYNFLKEGKWQEADLETIRVMLEVANREEKGWLLTKNIEEFPDSDLKIINNLWVKHSNAHFGFSIQQEICCKLGGQPSQFKSIIFHKFCQKVGWYRNENYLKIYQHFTFKIDAPRGHLPTLRFPAFENDMNYMQAWQKCFINFLNRL